MGSGLSMASVNKIKELAESRDYSVAVDILDAQDLEKSLNPQFVRTCGEVYENVGRYKDARKQYVRAHIMADGNSKVIQSLVILYLKRGFKELAQKYYEHYIFIEKASTRKVADINYIMKKASGEVSDEMYEILFPYYRDNMDEEWSYELILLSMIMGKYDGLDILVSDYLATFKNSKRIEYISAAFADREKAEELFNIFSEEEAADDDPDEEEVRRIEAEQLERDYYLRNPKEPEILIMVDALQEDMTDKQKRKAERKNRKEVLKNIKKDAEKQSAEEGGETTEGLDGTNTDGQDDSKDISAGESIKHSIKDFIKRKFRREEAPKDEEDGDSSEKKDAETEKAAESPEKKEEAGTEKASENLEKKEDATQVKEEVVSKVEAVEKAEEPVKASVEEIKEEVQDKTDPADVVSEEHDDDEIIITDAVAEAEDKAEGQDVTEVETEDNMRELKPDTSIDDLISYDFDDGFAPESDTIAELDDSPLDFSNPFDSISAYKKDEEEKKNSEIETSGKTFDDLRIELEINNVDESTSNYEPEPEIIDVDELEDTAFTAEQVAAADAENEVQAAEVETEKAEDYTEAEVKAEEPVFNVDTVETVEEVNTEEAAKTIEPACTVETTVAEPESMVAAEEIFAAIDEAVEETAKEKTEPVEEVASETATETAKEFTATVETEVKEVADTVEITKAAPEETKSSLFADVDKKQEESSVKINEVNKKESELDERLKKEAELQRQAEELLKSLGIDI